jgi:hypothetical protein
LLSTLISSKTRVKLLLKFFLNSDTTGYLRGLESEFGDSTNAIRQELNRFEEAGLLQSYAEGNKKFFQANTSHPLFREIHSIMLKHLGLDQLIATVVERLGNLDKAYLTGDFAKGKDSPIIDLLLIGNPDRQYLQNLVEKAEKLIHRKISFVVYHTDEAAQIPWSQMNPKPFLLWSNSQETNKNSNG